MCGAGIGLAFLVPVAERPNLSSSLATGAFLLCAFAMGGHYLVLPWRYRVTFEGDAVEIVTVFSSRRIRKADVAGWRPGRHAGTWALMLVLHLKGEKTRDVELPLANRTDEAIYDFLDGLENLAETEQAESVEAVLSDEVFGRTRGERLTTVNRERRIAGWVQGIGFIVTLWIVAWPEPYEAALIVSLALPIAVLMMAILLWGRWAFDDNPSDQRPDITGLVMLCAFPVMIRALSDYRIVDYGWVLLGAVLFGLVASTLAPLLVQKPPKLGVIQAMLAIPFAVYAYGAAIHLDVQLDGSAAQVFEVEVRKSSVDKDGDASLTIAAWGPYKAEKTFDVGRRLQKEAPVGSRVRVNLHRGLLGVRWWTIRPPLAPAGG